MLIVKSGDYLALMVAEPDVVMQMVGPGGDPTWNLHVCSLCWADKPENMHSLAVFGDDDVLNALDVNLA